MDSEFQRKRLIDQYKSYMSILSTKGVQETELSDAELMNMDLADLSRVVRETKDLARTPN